MTEYKIGQIFEGTYPEDAAQWCNENNCYIEEIKPDGDVRRFEILEIPEPTEEEKQAIRIEEIKRQLDELDLKTIRPLRAGETDRLVELETQAEELRKELQYLTTGLYGDSHLLN